MAACSCGRPFASSEALEQHRLALLKQNRTCTTSKYTRVLLSNTGLATSRTSESTVSSEIKDKWMFKNVADRIHIIGFHALDLSNDRVSSDAPCQVICSYSWANRKNPTIYVPGEAPRYVRPHLPLAVAPDRGVYFIDQNGSRVPRFPFEPVFQAIHAMQPHFRFNSTHVLVNRNSLRKLLDLCHGRYQKSFRLNLRMVHDTLLIERLEKNPKEYMKGSAHSSYGHNFERSITAPSARLHDAVGYHRVLTYTFADLNLAVCFEVDAGHTSDRKDGGSMGMSSQKRGCGTNDVLQHAFRGAKPHDKSAKSQCSRPAVTVVRRGRIWQQSDMAEIKSGTGSKGLGTFLPQLWFGRTPYLIEGHHHDGNFDDIQVNNVTEQLKGWENREENQIALRKLAGLLTTLRETTRRSESGYCIAISQRCGSIGLEIYSAKTVKDPFPDDTGEKLWDASSAC